MRKTNRYGRALGAVVVELRRGSVHHVDIGIVERFPPETQIIGAPLLRFTPQGTVTGRAAKTLAAMPSDAIAASFRDHDTKYLDRFDNAIRAYAPRGSL